MLEPGSLWRATVTFGPLEWLVAAKGSQRQLYERLALTRAVYPISERPPAGERSWVYDLKVRSVGLDRIDAAELVQRVGKLLWPIRPDVTRIERLSSTALSASRGPEAERLRLLTQQRQEDRRRDPLAVVQRLVILVLVLVIVVQFAPLVGRLVKGK